MIMQTHSTWPDWFINHANNDAGNRNLEAFSNILSSGDSNEAKLRALVKEIDTVILAADSNKNIMILHSPKNFGGTRSRPKNKVVCMLGIGPRATYILPNSNTALADIQIVVPTVQDLAGCESPKEVANIPAPEENGLVGVKGSAIFIPGPILWNTIIPAKTKNPFELIPIISQAARSFNKEHELEATAVTHADDLNAWLYGVKTGLVPETRQSVNPDDTKIATFCNERHLQCITLNATTATSTRAGGSVIVDNASVISQLTNAISIQNKEAIESNNLPRKEIKRQIEWEEKKKDTTKNSTHHS
jgi:hypothetical protein